MMSHVYYCCNSSCLKQSDVELADSNLLRNFKKKFPKTTPLPPLPPKKRQCPLSWGSAFVLYLGFLQMNESSSSITKILSPTILTCLLLPWTLQKLTIRALTTPTTPPPKRSHYNLVTLVVQLNAKKINKKYKIITQKENYTFCSANTVCFFSPHWPISPLQSRKSSEMLRIPISPISFLSAIFAFQNFNLYIRSDTFSLCTSSHLTKNYQADSNRTST